MLEYDVLLLKVVTGCHLEYFFHPGPDRGPDPGKYQKFPLTPLGTAGRVCLQKAGLGLLCFLGSSAPCCPGRPLSVQGTGSALLAVLSTNGAVAGSQLPLGDIPYFGHQCSPLFVSATLCSAEGA